MPVWVFSLPLKAESPICHDTISIFKFYSDWDFILVNALSETSFQVNSSLKMLSMVHCKKKLNSYKLFPALYPNPMPVPDLGCGDTSFHP
jgi:hypothetical protein